MHAFAKRFKPIHMTAYERTDTTCRLSKDSFPDCAPDAAHEFHRLTRHTTFTWEAGVVHFYCYPDGDPDLRTKFQHIATLLHAIQPADIPIQAHILLTRAKKRYPKGVVFGPENANTGWSMHDKLVVYREEEWLKVFIHECFHFFNFEKHLNHPQYSTRLARMFQVRQPIYLAEVYCEFWARIINCMMISQYADIPLDVLMKREAKHSVRHMINVLHHMNVKYTSLFQRENTFQENTNILAYVVVTAVLMGNHYYKYVDFSTMAVPFESKAGRTMLMFLKQYYRCAPFLAKITNIVPHVTTTMSLFNIDNYTEMRRW